MTIECSARVWSKDRWYPHQCENTAKGEREGYSLCKTHMNMYDRGRFISAIVAIQPDPRHYRSDFKTVRIGKSMEENS